MAQPIVYVDTSEVLKGKLNDLRGAMTKLATFIKVNVPRIIFYAFYLDENEKTMTVISVHPDSECLGFHMDKGNEEFRKFGDLIQLKRIEVYGEVTETVVKRLYKKAEMLGTGKVNMFHSTAGFSRIPDVR